MKLDQQICSLDLAKRLKELGAKQESLCVWVYVNDDEDETDYWTPMTLSDRTRTFPYHKWISAFTVAEFGEMLPSGTWIQQFKHELEWQVVRGRTIEKVFCAETEADVRAKMLVCLLENKLIPTSTTPADES